MQKARSSCKIFRHSQTDEEFEIFGSHCSRESQAEKIKVVFCKAQVQLEHKRKNLQELILYLHC